jgi:hypothetical protein
MSITFLSVAHNSARWTLIWSISRLASCVYLAPNCTCSSSSLQRFSSATFWLSSSLQRFSSATFWLSSSLHRSCSAQTVSAEYHSYHGFVCAHLYSNMIFSAHRLPTLFSQLKCKWPCDIISWNGSKFLHSAQFFFGNVYAQIGMLLYLGGMRVHRTHTQTRACA